jgi:hypothetical protein
MRFLFFVLMMIPALAFSQSWNYSYVDPCTKKVKTLTINNNQSILVNYYGVVNTFNASDFTNGNFESWILTTAAINSAKPCDEVTTALTNNTNSVILSNTINVVTNVMAVTQMASSLGTSMTSTAESINNSSTNSGSGSKKENKNGTNSGTAAGSNGNGQGTSASGNSSQNTSSPGAQGGNVSNSNNTTSGGSQTSQQPVSSSQNGNSQNGNSSQSNGNSNSNGSSTGSSNSTGNGNAGSASSGSGNTGSGTTGSGNSGSGSGNTGGSSSTGNNTGGNTGGSNGSNTGSGNSTTGGNGGTNSGGSGVGNPTSGESQESLKTGGSGSTANSVSNAVDGGGSSGGSGSGGKSNSSKAQSGSLIASGDVVVISNTGETREQLRFVGSITKSNTTNRKVTGALFTYTTGINTANVTLYKSFVSEQRKYNLVVANSSMLNPDKDFFNTTTALETVKWKKFTFMGGINYTVGNLGETKFMNLSTVLGAHGAFRVSPRINTSILMMSIYSPFTQFYDGKWWDAGLLVVPFSSWDFKITKTFKYNISFTGVYEMNNSFLNYQILTGGKINF